MSLVINTNVASLNAQRSLSNTQSALAKNLSHLSSGLRISSASDDAAGLAISENLKADIRSFTQAQRNASDGVSLTQVAEGALEQMGNLLGRMRELAVEASNGTVDTNSSGYLNNEFKALTSEIDRIAKVTSFNGTNLLTGAVTATTIQVGINNSTNDVITIAISNMATASLGATTTISASNLNAQTSAQSALANLDAAISQVSAARASLGALVNRFDVTIANLSSTSENYAAANSRIRDVDVASETAALTRNQILSQAGVAVLAQANQLPSAALSLLK